MESRTGARTNGRMDGKTEGQIGKQNRRKLYSHLAYFVCHEYHKVSKVQNYFANVNSKLYFVQAH